MINHINLPDTMGQVYCCLRNRVVRYDAGHRARFCGNCKMFNGTAGGCGVECLWDDSRAEAAVSKSGETGAAEYACVVVTDPVAEWAAHQKKRVQQFIAEWNREEEETGYEPFVESSEAAG